MREILFRGKSAIIGRWIEGVVVYNDHDAFSNIIPVGIKIAGCYPIEVIPKTIGQFTGLTDINGKKIFEGDILRSEEYGTTMLAIWSNEKAAFMLDYYSDVRYFHDAPIDIEIIGNIHDNPELF